MGKTLKEMSETVAVAQVVHHGEQLIVPEDMTTDQAIALLERRKKYLEEKVELSETFNAFPFDGANALQNVLSSKYGWATAEPTPGFFGSTPPRMIRIEVAPGEYRQVPWSRFSVPGITGYLEPSVQQKNGRFYFRIEATILRKDEGGIEDLFTKVREELKNNSIYEGKAIKIRFRDENGNNLPMPEPTFLDTSNISRDMLVYSKDIEKEIETNLFTPIQRIDDCIANDIPVKRGVILGGPYGTGKTMAATVASKIAVDTGVTYVYIPRADELADAIEFAKQYQKKGCVIFCEDIDRAMSGERSVEMDDILNILDGIDTKSARIITVLTTNHLTNINPAMLRPGRLDSIINVLPPDAEAVERLLHLYGGETIMSGTDLKPASEVLKGKIPAVIAEVVKRAKLYQVGLQAPGTKVAGITGEAILQAAETIDYQVKLLEELSTPKEKKELSFTDLIKEAIGTSVVGKKVEELEEKTNRIYNEVC